MQKIKSFYKALSRLFNLTMIDRPTALLNWNIDLFCLFKEYRKPDFQLLFATSFSQNFKNRRFQRIKIKNRTLKFPIFKTKNQILF